jgi:FixJ family two-component response regulator
MGTMPPPAPDEAPRVFLVDDHASVRRSLERVLRAAGYRVESFSSARMFLASGCHAGATGCLLLDLCMPELDGLALQAELARLDAALAIVFITGNASVEASVRAMRAGAVDFLAKPVAASILLESVRRALARAVNARAARAELAAIRALEQSLTRREHEVMKLVVEGLLNKQVAGELGVSEKTVKIHRARVMEKTRARSLPDLVRFAARLGIPSAP